jgi:hypothetical protein
MQLSNSDSSYYTKHAGILTVAACQAQMEPD